MSNFSELNENCFDKINLNAPQSLKNRIKKIYDYLFTKVSVGNKYLSRAKEQTSKLLNYPLLRDLPENFKYYKQSEYDKDHA